jgi:DNA-binding NarL/FixJ family response regulator
LAPNALYSANSAGSTTTYGTRVLTSSIGPWPTAARAGSTDDGGLDTTAGGRPVRVVVGESHEVYRGGLLAILRRSPQLDVVGEAADGPGCVQATSRLRPDVLVVDLHLQPTGGLEVIRRVLAARSAPPPRVIVMAARDDDELVTEALRAGARGCLCKSTTGRALVDAIGSVARGGAALDPAVAQRLIEGLAAEPPRHPGAPGQTRAGRPYGGPGAAPHRVPTLTGRQADVLRLVSEGLSNAEIATALHVSEATVKSHLSALLRKLHLRDRTQLAVYALRQLP